MPKDREIVYAASRDEAIEQVFNLYPTATNVEIESRRNAAGHFSTHGHTFVVVVQFTQEPGDYEEEPFDDLGEEEY